MIVDLAQRDGVPNVGADVCIVGAGAAGIVLAAELVRQGRRVLLLESGGWKEEDAIQQLNHSNRSGQPLKAVHPGRFRSFGGSTKHWGGQISEFEEQDFEAHPGIPGSGWPISKAVLEPYYMRAQRAEGLAPVYQTDNEVWQQAGMRTPDFGDGVLPYFTRWCPETNFARLYRDLPASPQICVILHATACSLRWDAERNEICGVLCRSLSGAEHVFQAERYVFCLGTIETIQLLLQPVENTSIVPWQQNGLLGRHLQSHIDYNAARVAAVDRKGLEKVFPNIYLRKRKYHPKLRISPTRQREEGLLNIAGAISFISLGNVEQDMLQMKTTARHLLRGHWNAIRFRDVLSALRRLPILLRLATSFYISHRAYWPRDVTYWLRVHCEQEPLSDSRITLLPDTDALGMFRTHIDWRISPLEWKTIGRFTAMVQQALQSAGLATLEPQPELALEDGYCNLTFDDSYHWVSGARMSVSAADGVVDANLKLHGVQNAYVCSSAVYPTSGFANPVHTMLALAIRLADHLVALSVRGAVSGSASGDLAANENSEARVDA